MLVLSVFKLKISTRVTGSPSRQDFAIICVVLENLYGGATRPREKFYDIFIRFDTIPAVTGGQTR